MLSVVCLEAMDHSIHFPVTAECPHMNHPKLSVSCSCTYTWAAHLPSASPPRGVSTSGGPPLVSLRILKRYVPQG